MLQVNTVRQRCLAFAHVQNLHIKRIWTHLSSLACRSSSCSFISGVMRQIFHTYRSCAQFSLIYRSNESGLLFFILQIKTSNRFLIGMWTVLAGFTAALGPLAMFNLYFMPYWINVMWLDAVTYLHHHGSENEEKIPWYRGEVLFPHIASAYNIVNLDAARLPSVRPSCKGSCKGLYVAIGLRIWNALSVTYSGVLPFIHRLPELSLSCLYVPGLLANYL